MDRLERPPLVIYRKDKFAWSFVFLIASATLSIALYALGVRESLWIALIPFLFALATLFYSRAVIIDRAAGRVYFRDRIWFPRTRQRELAIDDLSIRAELVDDQRFRHYQDVKGPSDGAWIWLDVRGGAPLLFERCEFKEEAGSQAERLSQDLGRPFRINHRILE